MHDSLNNIKDVSIIIRNNNIGICEVQERIIEIQIVEHAAMDRHYTRVSHLYVNNFI